MYDIYCNDRDDQWRYTLGKSGARPLFAIGLNPSTATQEKSDTTVAKVERVARMNGFDGFVMLNLYPVRATNYRELPRRPDRVAYDTNIDRIETLVREVGDATLWAAWGNPVTHFNFFLAARNELWRRLAPFRPRWVRHGELTGDGHPRHPSRLRYAWQFQPFELARP